MAKPIVELLTELQKAVEKSDANQTALQKLQSAESAKQAKAKSDYDAVVAGSQAVLDAARAQAAESEGYVKTLQTEVNAVLGRRESDARVRVG